MAATFIEPGGDATFANNVTTADGFYGAAASGTIATDFVHGNHQKSIKFTGTQQNITPSGTIADAGTRFSFYIYINALPGATATFAFLRTAAGSVGAALRMTTGGTLQIWNANSFQLGTNGATLNTGQWYRVSLAYTITSGSVNRFELFVDGVSSISLTNQTVTNIACDNLSFGNPGGIATFDIRFSDIYIDNSASLTDTGNIWVTAKRPVSNGTTNGFTTQIGAGGSGYGTGHAPQVNERAISQTNGWSMIGAGAAVTEEYSIEGKAVGDMDISAATIVDWMAWIDQKAVVSETATLIYGALTSTYATSTAALMVMKCGGTSNYPAGGTDVGMTTSTDLTTVSLFECGINVAFIPPGQGGGIMLGLLHVG